MGIHLKNSFSPILAGYRNLILISAKIILLLAAAAAINIILIYPMWYAAIRHTEIYTSVMEIIFSVLLLLTVTKGIKKKIILERQAGRSPFGVFIKPAVKAVKLAVFLVCVYVTAIAFHLKSYPAAAACFAVTFTAGGYMFFRKNNR